MNERLTQMQLRLAVLEAKHAGLSDARRRSLERVQHFRGSIARVNGSMPSIADLERVALCTDDQMRALGFARLDLNRIAKDVRFLGAIDAEMTALARDIEPLRGLIDQCEHELSPSEQW
jgi:hypothetical protein